jgi:hypothetical protein
MPIRWILTETKETTTVDNYPVNLISITAIPLVCSHLDIQFQKYQKLSMDNLFHG